MEVITKLNQWCSDYKKMIDETLNLAAPFLLGTPVGKSIMSQRQQWLLNQLAISCNITSESTLLLLRYGRLWDAEILLRSVTEGTMKFVFLCLGDETEREKKSREYGETLPDLAQLKAHEKIHKFLTMVDNPGAIEWRPFQDLLLSPETIEKLRNENPRLASKQIQQKWSFMEIIRALSDSGITGFDGFIGLAFNFGTGSHHVHKDADAVGMIWDREQREPERREALVLAHGQRILSDLSAMAMLRTLMVFKIYQADVKPLRQLDSSYEYLHDEAKNVYKMWHNIEYEMDVNDRS
jgi:hypothetical protein